MWTWPKINWEWIKEDFNLVGEGIKDNKIQSKDRRIY